MRTTARVTITLFLAVVSFACFAQSRSANSCPQPRFTGKAPEPYYSQKNPLPADRDLSAAERLFKGEVQGKFGCSPCHGPTGGGRRQALEAVRSATAQFRLRRNDPRCA